MTPSPIRPVVSRTASRGARRTSLLAASALCGVAAMLASPALAGTLPGIPSAANITVSSGGAQPTISFPDAITLQIELNASKTVINWTDLHLSSGDAMNFLFDAADDIVLNKTTSQIRFDSGSVVTGKVGATTAGNVWFYSPQGVIVSPGATMTAGGFLFSRGSGLNDATFAASPNNTAALSNLRAAADALIKINSLSTATSASIDAAGNVLLSRSSGNLVVDAAVGSTVTLSTTTGSISVSEVTSTSGAAQVLSGGSGATVTQITGATGVTVSSTNNTSVGSATTTTSGDIVLTSGGGLGLTSANAAGDVLITAPDIDLSSIDAGRDVILTGTTSIEVFNYIHAGDDIEITASNGDVSAGTSIVTSGAGATDDAHILIRSDTGSVIVPGGTAGRIETSGTGVAAGDITIQAATSATLSASAFSSRDIKVSGASVSVGNATAARDLFATASAGAATVTGLARAGDDVEVTAAGGAVAATGATLRSTGVNATDDAHVLARSTTGAVNVGAAQTQGTGVAAGDVTIQAATTASLGSGDSTLDLRVSGATATLTTGTAARDIIVTATSGAATVTTAATAGDDVIINADGDVLAGGATLKGTGTGHVGAPGSMGGSYVYVASATGAINVGSALTEGTGTAAGDVVISATTTATLGSGGASRDLTVAGANPLSLTGSYSATRTASLTSTAGAITQSGGSITAGTLTVDAASGIVLTQAGNDVTRLGAIDSGSGSFSYRDLNDFTLVDAVVSGGDVSLTSTGGAISQTTSTITADVLNVTAATGIDLNRENTFTSLGVVNNTTSGSVMIRDADDLDITNDIDTAGDILLYTTNGDITHSGGTLHADGDFFLDSGGLINVGDVSADGSVRLFAAGDIDVNSATAGNDIVLGANGGHAVLRKAVLTGSGAGHDLSMTGVDDVILGADDDVSITTDNVFTRTGASTGAATVRSTAGDVRVNLDASAAIGALEGENIVLTVDNGALNIGTATANTGDLELNGYGGAVTVGAVNAPNGNLGVYAYNGGLTITGSAHAGLTAQLQSLDLLDGTSASLISSDGTLQLFGGQIDVGALQAGDAILVGADDGNIAIQSAQAGIGISVATLAGDIFVDTAEADQGVGIQATGDVLVNSAKSNGAGGGVLVQADGDAVVNLAEAKGANGFVEVDAFGNATLRAAEATDGILVYAADAGKATFGADDGAPITNAYYGATAVGSGVSCGCGLPVPDGLQVYSEDGDASVNVYSLTNPIALVASGEFGTATVTLQTGDLKIDELAGNRITIDARGGTLETGATFSSGGDYTITAHDFLGDALTPFLVNGVIHDVTITDTLGDLNLGSAAIHADRRLTIVVQDGAVTGAAQLSAGSGLGDGRVAVTGDAIAVDTVSSDGLVNLDGGTGLIDVATSVSVDGDYTLKGGAFSDEALAPLGLKAGLWSITDRAGGFDFTGKTLRYGGALALFVNGVVNGGDITTDTDTISVDVSSGHLGALTAGGASVTVTSSVGGVDVDSAEAGSLIRIWASNGGAARLGAATLNGAGANQLIVKAFNGDAILGASTPGAITAANFVSSSGATTTVDVTAPVGRVDINLDQMTGADLTTVDGASGAAVKVANGSLRIVNVAASSGAVTIDGPTGALTVDQLTALLDSQVSGGGDTRLVSADVGGDLAVTSTTGGLRFGDATPGRVIEVGGLLSLSAATDIAQQGDLHAFALGATAGTGVVLLGDNQVQYLDAIDVAAGGFAFHDTLGFELNGAVDAVGQTVDLRSDGAITQASTGTITAQTLTGSSVGGASFGAFNQVAELGDFSNTGGGLLKLVEGRSLTVGGTVYSSGTVALTSHGGMTIAATGTVRADGAGDAAVLVSDGVFTNARGSDAVQSTNPVGRWLIYTEGTGPTPANTFNGLSGKSFYGSAYDYFNERFAVAPNAGNRFVYSYQPTITVAPDSRIVTYNGAVPTTSAMVTGLVNGDLFTDAWTGALVINGATSKAAGTYVLTADVSGLTSDLNYAFAAGPSGSLRIDPKALTAALTANDRTYDGTTVATGAIGLTGVVAGDDVSASGTYAFADKNAAAGKTVTASGVTLAGSDAGNYVVASTSTDTADIWQKALTETFTPDSKVYDGTTAATGSIGLTGVVAGDDVAASGTYTFADKNAAWSITVTASGIVLSGADAGNYSTVSTTTEVADILRKDLTGALTANTKTYDGGTATTGSISLSGVVAGETVGISGTYLFDDMNAGTGKTVTATNLELLGADSHNYNLVSVSDALADILRRSVTVAADNRFKVFGQPEPTLTYRVTVGSLVTGDHFTGALGRDAGEIPGTYGIARGTLALSANYDLTFTGAVFTIQPIPSNERGDGSSTLKYLNQKPDFTLDWDPESNLTTQGQGASQGGGVAGGQVIAALR